MGNKIDNSKAMLDLTEMWEHIKAFGVIMLNLFAHHNPEQITKWVALMATTFYLLNQAYSFIKKMRRNSKDDD